MIKLNSFRSNLTAGAFAATLCLVAAPAAATPGTSKSSQPAQAGSKVEVSYLFLIHSDTAQVTSKEGKLYVSLPSSASVYAFSDRPFRIAKTFNGGIDAFGKFFGKSSFKGDPPNVTFTGTKDRDTKDSFSIMTIGQPTVAQGSVTFPILGPLGQLKPPAPGSYKNVSFVVDSFWSWAGAVGSGVGTAALCTVGEVASMGADTVACAAGVAETVGAIGNAASGN